jgi:hypothetical protein
MRRVKIATTDPRRDQIISERAKAEEFQGDPNEG